MTFDPVYYRGQLVKETELFCHFHTPEMLLYYDGNFIQFKKMPTIPEWEKAVTYLREFHLKNDQDHVKVLFPENEYLPEELEHFVKSEGYEVGFLELYAVDPSQFPSVEEDKSIRVEAVREENLEELLQLKYEIDCEISRSFAEQKRGLHEQNFRAPHFLQLMAYFNDQPAGTVDVIINEKTVEIDGLIVLEPERKKGIGSQLQHFIMKEFPNKTVILLADGEDTPREMYKKQNYSLQGFKYEALKVYS